MGGSFGCGGCGKESAPADKTQRKADRQTDADAGADATMDRMRSVYGLPLPPSVMRIERSRDRVRVKTAMSIEEVASFFKARLTDYEVLRPRDQVRIVGLRDYMPELYAYPRGRRTFVVYLPAENRADKQQAKAEAAAEAKKAQQGAKSKGARSRPARHVKGQPVLDRTADGKLLAPGARWGEPYTPPEGSPLHNKHFESNFGKPYGQWSLQ